MINDRCFGSNNKIQDYRKYSKDEEVQRRVILSTLEYTSEDIGRKWMEHSKGITEEHFMKPLLTKIQDKLREMENVVKHYRVSNSRAPLPNPSPNPGLKGGEGPERADTVEQGV